MTPEQIERLKNAILHGPYYEGWTDDFLALLAEWEERGDLVAEEMRLHSRTVREKAVSQKWCALWKKLAQFRGWPASEHEKNRQRRVRAEARLAKVVEIIEEMADTDPDDGTAWFHERCADALAAAQPKEESHG